MKEMQSAVHPRATTKKRLAWCKGPWVRSYCFLLCHAFYMVPGTKTIPSFFVVPGNRYHTYINHTTTKASMYQVQKYECWHYWHIRGTSSQVPSVILHTYATMGTDAIKYSSLYIHATGQPATRWYHSLRAVVPVWNSSSGLNFPVQIEDISRASSTTLKLFWTRVEGQSAAK